MDSFDFNALDSAALDETLEFLNNYDPSSLLPDHSLAGFEDFGQPMMGWPVVENPAGVPLGNADWSGGVTDVLTDNSVPGFLLSGPGGDFENQPYPPQLTMGDEALVESSESRAYTSFPAITEFTSTALPASPNDSSYSSQTPSLPANRMNPRDFHATKMSVLDGSCFNAAFGFQGFHSQTDPLHLPRICDWPSCKSTILYCTTLDLCNHKTDVHIAHVLNSWPGPCFWPGCKSKIFFKTSKRLEDHVYNIHITPLCCTTPGCNHKRPFEREADLERHIASKHSFERKYKCPYPKCGYWGGFSRKDKLKLHERTYHGEFACHYNHCIYGFLSEESLRKHLFKRYDHYSGLECGLGSCARTPNSQFGRYTLKQHLEHDHLVSSEAARQAMRKTDYSRDTLTSAHFPDGFSDFQDCKGCVEKLKEAAASRDGEEAK